ncbi:MAG: AI-2E family transporter [Coleofasciculaceae cyanobacterium RL_1_1]|nr:AI-2E family transporter [Coleofasciculaceae cyanobacterium RL_1_1]
MNFNQIPRWLMWSLFLPMIALNIWIVLKAWEYFHSFFSIIIIATLLAFILSYPVRKLQHLKLSKQISIGLVLLLVAISIGLIGVTLLPLIFDQVLQLSERLPDWWVSSRSEIEGLQIWVEQHQFPINLADVITELEGRLSGQIQALSGLALSTVPIAISNIVDIFLSF